MTAPISSFTPGVLAHSDAARVGFAPRCARFSLRARGDLAPLEAALGLSLPTRIGQRVTAGERQLLCLGPDEWVLHAPERDGAAITAACAGVYADHPHSLVDISGREVSFVIDGPRGAELLTLGCARDLDSIAVGEGRRTLFDGATVILWRDGDTSFRLDCWNSFATHLFHLLDTGVRELAAESL
ncbi:sarcosine oxidase subunit gamma family protein [Pseudodonghicola flavimaris]|uniref:Sarcosine oxidase subunit gamma family protein n=1 Tax=Pseudodonghicola flavimaris TaxID=3050036 RepID=A0ABT7F4Y4_9RHOB|nr:sarcosine oxidase subunit gamma family protein [Pseudodonghicola flavimaris]MDK3019647.1 sarcosine oxidase subunit gamma family protein [Pseudodonghicola flavimaris]